MSQRRRNTVRKKAPRQILSSDKARVNGNVQYKRSLSVQALSTKESGGRKRTTAPLRTPARRNFPALKNLIVAFIAALRLKQKYQDISYGIFALLIAVFILYSLLPWQKLSSVLSDISLGYKKSVSTQAGPLCRHFTASSQPFLKLRPVSGDLQNEATALLSVKSGDSLRTTLLRHGFTNEESVAAQQALVEGSVLPEGETGEVNLKVGDSIEVLISGEGLLSGIKFSYAPGKLGIINRKSDSAFNFSAHEIEKTIRERMVVGSIKSSFAAAALKAGLSYDIVDDLVDIFSDRVSFHRDFRKGDRFTLIYHEHEMADATKATNGPILAAALEVKGEHFLAVRYVGIDGKARYFNEKGHLIGNTFLRYPLKFSRISSYFSDGRLHPVLKIKRPHHGVDFAAPTGTPVRTIGDGVVTFAGRKGGHGIIVEIRHSERFTTGYSHLSEITPGISRGRRVQRGELIGKVGMTGLATGPHLHFSLYDNGIYTDPLQAKLPQIDDLRPGIKISTTYLSRALYTLTHFQTVKTDPDVLQSLYTPHNLIFRKEN